MRQVLFAGAALALAFGGGMLALQLARGGTPAPAAVAPVATAHETAERSPSPSWQMAAVEAHVASLERQLTETNARLAAAANSAQPATASEASEPPPNGDARSRAEVAQRRRDYLDRLELTFRNEAIDQSWSAHATRSVHDVLERDEALRGAVRSLECRAQLCRLELKPDVADKLAASYPQLSLSLASELPNIVVDNGDREHDAAAPLVLYFTATPGVLQPSKED
jgi:hypothetical protein